MESTYGKANEGGGRDPSGLPADPGASTGRRTDSRAALTRYFFAIASQFVTTVSIFSSNPLAGRLTRKRWPSFDTE